MDHSSGIRASLAGRYATALFALAEENKSIDMVQASLGTLSAALDESDDLQSADQQPGPVPRERGQGDCSDSEIPEAR